MIELNCSINLQKHISHKHDHLVVGDRAAFVSVFHKELFKIKSYHDYFDTERETSGFHGLLVVSNQLSGAEA